MKITRNEPVDNPVFIELTQAEAELLINYLGRTSCPGTEIVLGINSKRIKETSDLLYEFYCKLDSNGVKYEWD